MTSMSNESHQKQDDGGLVKHGDSVASLSLPTTDVNENHLNGGSSQTSPVSTQSDLSHSGVITGISQPDNFSPAVSEQSISSNSCTPRSRKRGDHIKRPMNAFLIWSTRRRHEIKEGEQQITMAEISKRLGQEWKDMTIEERQPFIDQAKQIRADHMTKYPDYKYQPRRKKTSGVVSKVKTSGGVSENSSAISLSNAHVDIPVSSSHGQLNATQMSGSNAGQGVIYQTASTQLLANGITQPQQLQFQAQRDNDQQSGEQTLQMGTNTSLSQSQQVIVTTPCLMPATGNQTGYTVILPSNHNNGLPIYLRALPQQQSQNPQQPQAIMQPQFLTSQTGTVAQSPLQASPQLQAAVQPQQNQLPNLQPQLIPAGNILMSGGALQPIQPLTEGQVPFSQM